MGLLYFIIVCVDWFLGGAVSEGGVGVCRGSRRWCSWLLCGLSVGGGCVGVVGV